MICFSSLGSKAGLVACFKFSKFYSRLLAALFIACVCAMRLSMVSGDWFFGDSGEFRMSFSTLVTTWSIGF